MMLSSKVNPIVVSTGATLQAAGRFSAAQIETRYYTPAIHCAAFILPGFMREFS